MDHALVIGVEKALGWSGPSGLGGPFARGALDDLTVLDRLLTIERLLDLMMRRSLGNPQVRAFRDGHELHPGTLLDEEPSTRGKSIPMVSMGRLAGLLRDGVTLVLDRVNVYDPTMEVTCRAFQWWASEAVQVNVYLTTGSADGFQLHWDDHDVVVVQLAGSKEWEVRGPSRPYPMFRDASREERAPAEVVWRGALSRGEILHVPRGHWHAAGRTGLSASGWSLHATFGFAKRTGANWAAWLADWAREHELFRRDLIRRSGPEAAAQNTALTDAFIAIARARPQDDYLIEAPSIAPAARHIPYLPTLLPQPQQAVCVSAYSPQIRAFEGRIEVRAAGRRLTLPARHEALVRVLLSGHPVHVADLDMSSRQVLVLLLVEGLCAPVTAEFRDGYRDLVPTLDLS